MRTLPIALAGFLLLLAAPVHADELTVSAPIVGVLKQAVDDAVDVQVGDSDGDGYDEASGSVGWGPACGCACPVVGAGVDVEAAGQKVGAEAATVILPLCGFFVGAEADPGTPAPMDAIVIDPDLWCWVYGDPLGMDGDCVPDVWLEVSQG